MDAYALIQVLWPCLRERYPEIAGAVLQVIGGATVLFRLLGSPRVGLTSESPFGLGRVLAFLARVALNKG